MDSYTFRALGLAPLAVLALAAPASAQTASPAPTPSVTSTATPSATTGPSTCPNVYVVYNEFPQQPNTPLVISVAADNGGRAIDYDLSRLELDGSYTVVRSIRGATSAADFPSVRLPQTTTLKVEGRYPGDGQCVGGDPTEVRNIAVRPTVSITAKRNSPRDYTFSGRVLPGRGQAVTLYRITADGEPVLTARTTVGGDGIYRIDRRFTGSGRFGFEARIGASTTNLAGASPVRPTVIH